MSQPNEKQNDGVKFQLPSDGLLERMQNCFSTQITLFILIRHFPLKQRVVSAPPHPTNTNQWAQTMTQHHLENRRLTQYSSNDDGAQCSPYTWADRHARFMDPETFAKGVCAVLCMDLSQMPQQQSDGSRTLKSELQHWYVICTSDVNSKQKIQYFFLFTHWQPLPSLVVDLAK